MVWIEGESGWLEGGTRVGRGRNSQGLDFVRASPNGPPPAPRIKSLYHSGRNAENIESEAVVVRGIRTSVLLSVLTISIGVGLLIFQFIDGSRELAIDWQAT